jgi:hypothetical protein
MMMKEKEAPVDLVYPAEGARSLSCRAVSSPMRQIQMQRDYCKAFSSVVRLLRTRLPRPTFSTATVKIGYRALPPPRRDLL